MKEKKKKKTKKEKKKKRNRKVLSPNRSIFVLDYWIILLKDCGKSIKRVKTMGGKPMQKLEGKREEVRGKKEKEKGKEEEQEKRERKREKKRETKRRYGQNKLYKRRREVTNFPQDLMGDREKKGNVM